MNIINAILWASEQCSYVSDSPRLDAEVLLAFSLNKESSYLRTWPERALTPEQIKHYQKLIQLRLKPTPIAYITGIKEFWSRDFKVNPSTLIPRPDTECLIENSLDYLAEKIQPISILDLGTGSGCIAITLKKENSDYLVTATDISPEALAVAKENAANHRADIQFILSSWYNAIDQQKYDLIVSNPPYIREDDNHLSMGDLPAEPISALTSGETGLDDIKIIALQAASHLNDGGCLIVEHGYDQEAEVYEIFMKAGFKQIQQFNDYNGQPRLTKGLF
ncbi:MAG: peptide chain release factor N(5)-glutamine methyltransferase [Gammaproteobacteria bacterium]|nr:peptide chain release factor N(5)-glutamine methyltransferase [Gammaproteobacteria bacterium]